MLSGQPVVMGLNYICELFNYACDPLQAVRVFFYLAGMLYKEILHIADLSETLLMPD